MQLRNIRVLTCLILLTNFRIYSQELRLETAIQVGHYENVNLIEFTADGKFMVTASEDNTLKLWEVRSGREIRTFTGSTWEFIALGLSPDGKKMATVNGDSSAWVWDLATGEILFKFSEPGDLINNVLFTPDNKYLITAGRENFALLWDLATGTVVRRFKGIKAISCYARQCRVSLDIDRKGKFLLTGVGDRTTILWDLSSGELLQQFKENTGSCSSCMSFAKFDASGNVLSCESRGVIRNWKPSGGNEIKVIGEDDDYQDLQVSKGGQYFITLSREHLKVISQQSGREILTFNNYQRHVNAFAMSPDEKWLALSNETRQITLLDFPSGDTIRVLGGLLNTLEAGMNQIIRNWIKNKDDQNVSPNGKYVVRGKLGKNARIWDLSTGRILHDLKGHDGIVITSKFSPDGKYVATGGTDGFIKIWDVETGQEIQAMKGSGEPVFTVDFSPDGQWLVSGGWDSRCILWNVTTGRSLGVYRLHENGAPIRAAFTPNGMYLVTAGLDQRLILADIDAGKIVREFIGHTNSVPAIKFSADGKHMLTAGWDGLAFMWDLATGLKEQRFKGHDGPVYDIAINKSGTLVATGGLDKIIRLWDPATGMQKQTLSGHSGAVTSLTFSSDGTQLISGSRDGSTRVWDLESGKELFAHYFTGEDDWLVKTPEGYFYATDGARNSIFFVRGFNSYNIERFYEDFYSPGLLKEIFGEIKKKTRELNILNKLDESPPPIVEILSPKTNSSTEKETTDLFIKVTNAGGGINEILVRNNGKIVISDKENLDQKIKEGKSIFKNYKIPLVRGDNYLAVSAFSDGRIESAMEYVDVNLGGEMEPPDAYVMVVGINNYQNPRLNLNYAYSDAKGFADLLKKQSKKLFRNIEIVELYDEEATRENILSKLEELATRVRPQDVFYFYYAGHGSMVEDKFYFIPTENTRLYEQESLNNEAIYAGIIQEKLQKVQALKQVVVIDACHSGGSTELLAERGAGEEKALSQLSRSAGVHILAAAGSEQTAGEFKELGHGIFTYVLLKALSGEADGAPLDGKVTVYELKSFIDDQVPELSKKYKGSPQYPNTFSRGNDFPLSIQ